MECFLYSGSSLNQKMTLVNGVFLIPGFFPDSEISIIVILLHVLSLPISLKQIALHTLQVVINSQYHLLQLL